MTVCLTNQINGKPALPDVVFQEFDHFTGEVSLARAAAIANLSPPAFCAYFQKRTGRNLSEFANDFPACMAALSQTVRPVIQSYWRRLWPS
jgi:AraC-like DNA-binding protein